MKSKFFKFSIVASALVLGSSLSAADVTYVDVSFTNGGSSSSNYWLDKYVKNGETLKFADSDFSGQNRSYLGVEKRGAYGNDFLTGWDAVLDGKTFDNEFNGVFAFS